MVRKAKGWAERQTARSSGSHRLTSTTSLPALLDKGSDQRFRQLIHDFLSVSVRMQVLRDKLGDIAGLSGAQYSLLVATSRLGRHQSGVTVGGLAQHLHVSGTYVTAESKRLQAAGYLRKQPNPRDKRSVLLALTEKGDHTIEDLVPVIRAVNDTLFRDLDRDGFNALRSILANLANRCDEALLVADVHCRRLRA
jgi:MarR family transcriptional regulator, organic hydroperoxide resistance regulator